MDNIVKFVFVVDGEVAGSIHFDTTLSSPTVPRMIAALRSPHQVIEVDNIEISHGWVYDGVEFHPPVVEE